MLLLIKNLVDNLNIEGGEKLISSQDYLEQKLIGQEQIIIQDSDFEYWKDDIKEYVEDLIENLIDQNETTELLNIDYNIIKSNEFYNDSLLSTKDIHDKHIQWIALKNKAIDIQNKIGKKLGLFDNGFNSEKTYNNAKKELQILMNKNLKKILKKLTVAEDLYFFEEDLHIDFSFQEKPKDYGYRNFIHLGSKYGWSCIKKEDEFCPILPQYKGSTSYIFKIKHYKQLMFLLDCERKELPQYFRCYKHYSFIHYNGNSILDNVHPMSQIYDPCSKMFPNGIEFYIQISKRGLNSIKKENTQQYKKLSIDSNLDIYTDFKQTY